MDALTRYLIKRRQQVTGTQLLRPMSRYEVIDTAFMVYQQIGRRILKLTAIPSLFAFGGIAFLMMFLLPMLGSTQDSSSIAVQIEEATLIILAALFVAVPIIMLGIAHSSSIIVILVSNYLKGEIPNEQHVLNEARRRILPLTLLFTVEVILSSGITIVSLGFLMASAMIGEAEYSSTAGVLAGVGFTGVSLGAIISFFVIGYRCLAAPILIHENLKITQCGVRSRRLLKSVGPDAHGVWSAMTAMAIIFVLFLLFLPGLYGTVELLGLNGFLNQFSAWGVVGQAFISAIEFLPVFLAIWVLQPIWGTMITVLYFERRVRHEGFDIEVLAKNVWRKDRSNRFEL